MEASKALLPANKFGELDIRMGTIIDCHHFDDARKPAYKIWIDFGSDIGIKKSSAQLTTSYRIDQLLGKQVCAVINLEPRQIGTFMSECLVIGALGPESQVILLQTDQKVKDGSRIA